MPPQPSLWALGETGIFLPKDFVSLLEAARLRPFLPEAFDSLLAVEPSVIRYGASISACEKGAQPGQALELLRVMRRQCVETDVIRCKAAIGACADGAQPEQGRRRERSCGQRRCGWRLRWCVHPRRRSGLSQPGCSSSARLAACWQGRPPFPAAHR